MEYYKSWRVKQHPSHAAEHIVSIRFAIKRKPQTPDVYAHRLFASIDTICHSRIAAVAAEALLQQRNIKISRTSAGQHHFDQDPRAGVPAIQPLLYKTIHTKVRRGR